ncbi:MAG: peptidyl-prolyl cis-trans isomerase, partial [Acidobacteria bacterium]|nr:peptidyl-prolyl cis-trans isomerase [Acidobacteriota bacterium]
FLMARIIEELIRQRAVEYEAARLGFQAPPEEVAARLREMPDLYPDGKFVGAEAYRQIVQRNFGMSVPEFEAFVRRLSLQAKLFSWLTSGVTVSDQEVEQEYRRQQERVQLEYVVVTAEEFARRLSPTEQELRAYFEGQRARYQVPERRRLRAVHIQYSTLRQRLLLNPQEIEAYYRGHSEEYRVPEQVRLRHILFLRQPPGALAPRDPAELRQQAEAVLAQVRAGKDFAALARQHSNDQNSRERGGELGWVRRGQMPGVESAVFTLPPGSTELVETGYGFHIVQVLEHAQEWLRPLAEVRPEIELRLKQQRVQQTALEQAKELVQLVERGQALDAAAQELGWGVQELGPFARNESVPPFGNVPDLQDRAFRLPAGSAGQPAAPVSEPISLPSGYLILQLQQVIPSHQANFEEVRAQVEQNYRRERAGELVRQAAERLAAEAQKAGELRRAAQAQGLAVSVSEKLSWDGVAPGLGSVRAVASAAAGLSSGQVSPAVPVSDRWAVFRVLSRQEADLSRFTPEERKDIRERLLETKRGLAWNLFAESLTKRLAAEGVLKRTEAAIKRLTEQT